MLNKDIILSPANYLKNNIKVIILIALISVTNANANELPNYYFAYGSNMSHDFLLERLKDGERIDRWHKTGEVVGAKPVDLGCYVLKDYEFSYTLDMRDFGAPEYTAGNIIPKKGANTYGVLYKISNLHLADLDISEKVPTSYKRVKLSICHVNVKTMLLGQEKADIEVEAWAYIGRTNYIAKKENPYPGYIELLVKGANSHLLPESYINSYILAK